MCCETIMAPEVNLIKSDEFYLFYEMMMQSLKTDGIKEGINRSLFMLRTYLNSGNIALFRKNDDGVYVYKLSDTKMDEMVMPISCIINKTNPLVEQRGIFNMDLGLSERLQNMMLIHSVITNKDNSDECILAILNTDKEKKLDPLFWERVKETLQIVFKRAASYERNTKAITTDLLTGLDNRNSYEMRMQNINEEDNDLVLAIFDLFRLKYINDNFTHAKGDAYIKAAGKILGKYWPKEKVNLNENCIEERKPTGHCVYRYGGDEFVLLTNVEQLQLATIKSGLAKEEVRLIDLGLGENIPVGLNFGLAKHNPGDKIKNTFMRADEMMQEDKSNMYKRLKLDRRR